MKKIVMTRLRTAGLIGLISCVTVLGTSCNNLTYAQNTLTQANRPLASGFIWPTQGNFTQGFNAYHEGIDIAGSVGTPIVAAAAGTVIKAGWDDSGWGLGYEIIIQHPGGYRTVYAHNSRLLVSKGQQVIQGQAIAKMGSTGNSTGAHLHFEVHPQGRLAIDPLPLLPRLVAGKIPSLQLTFTAAKSQSLGRDVLRR
jgi:lipoprotein NlpD